MSLFFPILIGKASLCQNLVPNPSFELHGSIPCGAFTSHTVFNSIIDNWEVANGSTPDIFRSTTGGSFGTDCFSYCFSTGSMVVGHQMPHTGVNMVGIFTHGVSSATPDSAYRENIGVYLTSYLLSGQTYYAEMYVSLADFIPYANNNIGMYFCANFVPDYSSTLNLPFDPQIVENSVITDKINWVKISGTFVANGGENYLIIGNFEPNDQNLTVFNSSEGEPSWFVGYNGYYFIDDVLVREACFNVSPEKTICLGDSTEISNDSDSFLGWALSGQPNVIISTDSSLTVSPTITTTYMAYSNCDTASVTVNVIQPISDPGLPNDTLFCWPETLQFELENYSAHATYLWNDSIVSNPLNTIFSISQASCNTISVFNVCQQINDTICVTYFPEIISLGSDTTFCSEDSIFIKIEYDAAENLSFVWMDSIENNQFIIDQQGIYWLETSMNQCSKSDTISIHSIDCGDSSYNQTTTITLPNVFTPNNDNINDHFRLIEPSNSELIYVIIVNRWGETIFYSTDPNFIWNGTNYSGEIVPAGVYFWNLYYIDPQGQDHLKQGTVAVLR